MGAIETQIKTMSEYIQRLCPNHSLAKDIA